MRRLRIEHITGFAYQGEAGASYNETRMLPRSNESQFVLHTDLSVDPATSISYYNDYFGTLVASFDVLTAHPRLSITARSLVEVRPRPLQQSVTGWQALQTATNKSVESAEMTVLTPRTEPHPELVDIAKEVAAKAASPDEAARKIAEIVHDTIKYMPGTTGVNGTGTEAWELRKGVCQDFAHITIGALRSIGVPTRYVSGYLQPKADAEIGEPAKGESHAWVEWWCGRWQSFDPTNGIEVGNRHVLVGRGRDYTDVPPLRGVYDGPKGSNLHVSVTLTRES